MHHISLFQCPITKNDLECMEEEALAALRVDHSLGNVGAVTQGMVDQSGQYFYPIFDDILILHAQYATYIGDGADARESMSFDKKRVFDYYNEVSYQVKDALTIYGDSAKWVDFREVSSAYMKRSFTRAARFYPPTGQYFLDIASGPIGLPEYMALSEGYDYRICVDISVNALIQAKLNVAKAGKRGIFICGDITNIPLRTGVCDTVLSQHTLYHIPKEEQRTAVNEMYRVARPGAKIVIIYSWFYHSWFMNLSLHVVQLYRIARHFAGKLYVRLFPSKPRLYFYPHSPRWFKRSFDFSEDIEFYSWRSTNKYFMDAYVHKGLGGKKLLNALRKLEDKYAKRLSTLGEYAAIVITKRR